MITQENIERLDKLVTKYAMQDYLRANPKGKRKKYTPYSLSPRTEEARGLRNLAYQPQCTPEEEERIKAYLLRAKLSGEED